MSTIRAVLVSVSFKPYQTQSLFLIETLRKFLALQIEMYYHSQQHECDFVIKEKNRIVEAIQISWSVYNPSTREREIEGLLEALTCYKLREGLILTDDEEDEFTIKDFYH